MTAGGFDRLPNTAPPLEYTSLIICIDLVLVLRGNFCLLLLVDLFETDDLYEYGDYNLALGVLLGDLVTGDFGFKPHLGDF